MALVSPVTESLCDSDGLDKRRLLEDSHPFCHEYIWVITTLHNERLFNTMANALYFLYKGDGIHYNIRVHATERFRMFDNTNRTTSFFVDVYIRRDTLRQRNAPAFEMWCDTLATTHQPFGWWFSVICNTLVTSASAGIEFLKITARRLMRMFAHHTDYGVHLSEGISELVEQNPQAVVLLIQSPDVPDAFFLVCGKLIVSAAAVRVRLHILNSFYERFPDHLVVNDISFPIMATQGNLAIFQWYQEYAKRTEMTKHEIWPDVFPPQTKFTSNHVAIMKFLFYETKYSRPLSDSFIISAMVNGTESDLEVLAFCIKSTGGCSIESSIADFLLLRPATPSVLYLISCLKGYFHGITMGIQIASVVARAKNEIAAHLGSDLTAIVSDYAMLCVAGEDWELCERCSALQCCGIPCNFRSNEAGAPLPGFL